MGRGTDVDTTIYDRWDQFMDLLSAQPRRQVIVSLMEAPEGRQLALPDAALTPDTAVETGRFTVRLQQYLLPMLADAGYVRWSEDPFTVRRGPRFAEPAGVMQALLSGTDELPPTLVSGCVEGST